LAVDGAVSAAAAADPNAGKLFWTDGTRSFRRFQAEDHPLAPSAIARLIDINRDGPTVRSSAANS